MHMKKKITLALLMASLLLIVSACSKRNDENPIAKTISYRNITEIVASTQMTDMKQDIVLDEGNCRKLLDKLTSYSMNKIDGEIDKNGWEYLFRIKQGDTTTTIVSFMENRAVVNGIMYEVKDYSKEDFLKFF